MIHRRLKTLIPVTGFMLMVTVAAHGGQSSSKTSKLIPAGTTFRVRTIDPIDVDSSRSGMTFRGALDDPIMLDGDVVIPRGSDVKLVAAKVAQGGKMKGSDLVQLKVDHIAVNGRTYAVVTSISESKSGGEGKKT